MGTWGPGLYQNDISEDVKSFFRDQLRRGKTGEEITKQLIEDNREALNDPDDALNFWCALADTQWDMGRLMPSVKEKALEYLDRSDCMTQWLSSGAKQAKKRQGVLCKLREKLNMPPPEEKKVAQYKLYHCSWKIGDVFALPFDGELAQNTGFSGKSLLIKKVSECEWYPGHMIPVVHLKIANSEELPTCVEEYNRLEYIQIRAYPYSWRNAPIVGDSPLLDAEEISQNTYETDEFGFLPVYRIGIITTSRRSLPANLMYLGNYPDANRPSKEFIRRQRENVAVASWKDLCDSSIKLYFGHNKRQLALYSATQPHID